MRKLLAKASADIAVNARKGRDIYAVHQLLSPAQARIDKLDEGRRFVSPDWHDWGDPEEGGAAKASRVIQS